MNNHPTVAAVQMASGPNVDANLIEVERVIGAAAESGVGLVVLPENFAFMGKRDADLLPLAEPEGEGPLQTFLARTAARFGVWLVGGTIPMATASGERVRAATLVLNDRGERVARYDKMHLFDVSLPGADERYEESAVIEPGDGPVVVDTPFGRLGVMVCYDLRFPELTRRMQADGMQLLAVPSAFTALTGKAHWETLVRARAIENLSYVIAAAQGGYHLSGRETHGHSMIVDPWGTVLAQMSRGSGWISGRIDPDYQAAVRRRFPTLEHRRLKCG
ncbi:carbon-nitrogen hydrolase family protein [Thiohalocapsa marina]|uniref:Carbon-nitrogen hydrolase family protein n=1 Tax=Thiohalocapsa marina TaxID=424902 RepID=A0A5M8FTX1_9GAMM|nr:carbon-nitrogen hydrolase family protein [Thiohalocapsa marina]KAA6187261.1 carbon-nitrogen hydrolase family protein [Thiohalocapsa marina]